MIPFNKPFAAPGAWSYMQEAFERGHTAGDGPFAQRCQALLEEVLGAPRVLLTTSCTHALEMAALLLDVRPGDEVVVPAFTFVSTINAFLLRGARPVFVDVREDTLNLDERRLADALTPRTRAVVLVHYAGVGCEMEAIGALAERHGIPIVEDNAHGLLGRYRGRPLGRFGALAALSFHETKNIACGEGGALVLNDPAHVERAEVVREKGTDRSRFFRGQVERYTWVDLGSSYVPSDLLAALLLAQLEARDWIQAERGRIWTRYAEELADWAGAHGVRLPRVPEDAEHPFHLFYVLMPDPPSRDAFLAHLRAEGVQAVFHYQPLHLSRMGRRFGGRPGDCPVTEWASDRLVRLPLYATLGEPEQARVIDAIRRFAC